MTPQTGPDTPSTCGTPVSASNGKLGNLSGVCDQPGTHKIKAGGATRVACAYHCGIHVLGSAVEYGSVTVDLVKAPSSVVKL